MHLYCATDPIIESSQDLIFSIWNVAYPQLSAQFASAKLDPSDNHYSRVYDFNSAQGESHFSVLEAEQEVRFLEEDADLLGPCENPVPVAAPGNEDEQAQRQQKEGGTKSFSFGISQEEAEREMRGESDSQGGADDFDSEAYAFHRRAAEAAVADSHPQRLSSAATLWRQSREYAERIERKDSWERQKRAEARDEARRYLEGFHAERDAGLESSHRASLVHNADLVHAVESRLGTSSSSYGDNPWKMVCSYLDLSVAKTSGGKNIPVKSSGLGVKETGRMREILLQLKNQ